MTTTGQDEEQSFSEKSLSDTKADLESQVEHVAENETNSTEADEAESRLIDTDDTTTALLDRAGAAATSLIRLLSDDATPEETTDEIENFQEIATEAEELLATIDLTNLPDAINLAELPTAIEADNIPAAVAEGDLQQAIHYSELLAIVEFGELLDAVDVQEFHQHREELAAAVEDVTGDSEFSETWIVFDTLEEIVEILRPENGGDGLVDTIEGEDAIDVALNGEAQQAVIQSQLHEAIGEFRESVLEARARLEELHEEANEQIEETTGGLGQPASRNPTAFSTLTTAWKPTGGTGQYSTVPESTRYSTAPSHRRLYGSRFDTAEEDTNE
jgi:hypothetical protein